MKRSLSGLSQAASAINRTVDGVYLIRVEAAQHRWDRKKPYYLVRYTVVAPKSSADAVQVGRLYYAGKALWKLSWFLRDFGYDAELLKQDEVDEQRMVGLIGVTKISQTTVRGRTYLSMDAFAPAAEWEECSSVGAAGKANDPKPEVA